MNAGPATASGRCQTSPVVVPPDGSVEEDQRRPGTTAEERLLTRFSVPEELFGPLSLKGLENDQRPVGRWGRWGRTACLLGLSPCGFRLFLSPKLAGSVCQSPKRMTFCQEVPPGCTHQGLGEGQVQYTQQNPHLGVWRRGRCGDSDATLSYYPQRLSTRSFILDVDSTRISAPHEIQGTQSCRPGGLQPMSEVRTADHGLLARGWRCSSPPLSCLRTTSEDQTGG